jgi:hypothetical protein
MIRLSSVRHVAGTSRQCSSALPHGDSPSWRWTVIDSPTRISVSVGVTRIKPTPAHVVRDAHPRDRAQPSRLRMQCAFIFLRLRVLGNYYWTSAVESQNPARRYCWRSNHATLHSQTFDPPDSAHPEMTSQRLILDVEHLAPNTAREVERTTPKQAASELAIKRQCRAQGPYCTGRRTDYRIAVRQKRRTSPPTALPTRFHSTRTSVLCVPSLRGGGDDR